MCNHYTQDDEEGVIEWSTVVVPGLVLPVALPGYNPHIYPKRLAPIVTQESGVRSLVALPWGILRFIGQGRTKHVTNARNDKLLTTWKKPTAAKRCLLPATGYFEPGLGPVGAKGEILFTVKERPKFFIAGLWDTDIEGNRAFTMITTVPNEYVARYHDRMPVVLADADAEAWLGEEPLPDERLRALCQGLPSEALQHSELPPKLKITRPAKKPPTDEGPLLL